MKSKIILPLNMARAHAAAISNGLLQRVPQLVQQPEQLGVFLFRQQIGHIVVRLVEGEDGVFMEVDAVRISRLSRASCGTLWRWM